MSRSARRKIIEMHHALDKLTTNLHRERVARMQAQDALQRYHGCVTDLEHKVERLTGNNTQNLRQMADLAEQNEKLRDALIAQRDAQAYSDRYSNFPDAAEDVAEAWESAFSLRESALDLPDISISAFNRIKAHGMRLAARRAATHSSDHWKHDHAAVHVCDMVSCAIARDIDLRADELEQSESDLPPATGVEE